MAETRSRSIRVEDALWERFCAISGTQNEVFRELLEQAECIKAAQDSGPNLLQKVYERLGRIEIMAEEILSLGATVGNGSAGSEAAAFTALGGLPANATCRHHGGRFYSPNKYATICPGCKSIGHTNDPRDCPQCGETGTGAL